MRRCELELELIFTEYRHRRFPWQWYAATAPRGTHIPFSGLWYLPLKH
jgi:hypothetical protein